MRRSSNGCPTAMQQSVKKEKLDDLQMCYSKGYSGKCTHTHIHSETKETFFSNFLNDFNVEDNKMDKWCSVAMTIISSQIIQMEINPKKAFSDNEGTFDSSSSSSLNIKSRLTFQSFVFTMLVLNDLTLWHWSKRSVLNCVVQVLNNLEMEKFYV